MTLVAEGESGVPKRRGEVIGNRGCEKCDDYNKAAPRLLAAKLFYAQH
jgi:hypothetical protein